MVTKPSDIARESSDAAQAPRGMLRLAIGLVAVTYFLLVFGASVRVHGAGLACPDWPLCFGKVIPPIDFQVSLEFGHRVLAALISFGYAALLVGIWRHRSTLGRGMWGTALFGLAVLIVQVILGGLTVLELLAEWTVTSHLVTGNTFCAILLILALRLGDRPEISRVPVGAIHRIMAAVLAIAVFGQLALGGLVSSSHAGLVCGTWPTCDGTNWFPTFSGLVGLQVTHRLMAYLLIALGAVAVVLFRGRGRQSRAAWLVFGLILVQAVIGILNVFLRLPVEVTLAHSAGAAAIVLATTWLNLELWMAPYAARQSASDQPPVSAVYARRDPA